MDVLLQQGGAAVILKAELVPELEERGTSWPPFLQTPMA